MAYNIINLKYICESIGEKETQQILNNFKCDLNKDVEYFIREKAVEFSKQDISQTFIVTSSHKSEEVIVGYFALANKIVKVKKDSIKGEKRRRLARFAGNSEENKWFQVPLPLIGQLGKNYYNGYNELITGDDLLKMACDKIKQVQKNIRWEICFPRM